MREVLSGLMIRLVCFSIPLLLIADLTRALGKSVSVFSLVMAIVVPIIGLVVDTVGVRKVRSATGSESIPFDSPGRRRFQFSLRTLLIVMLFASIYCGFRFSGAVRQKRAITDLRAAGVPITYDYQNSNLLARFFSPEMFGHVKEITLRSDAEVTTLSALSNVTEVYLWGPGVTDASIKTLIASPQLRKFTLANNTSVTDAGVKLLEQSLPNREVKVYPR